MPLLCISRDKRRNYAGLFSCRLFGRDIDIEKQRAYARNIFTFFEFNAATEATGPVSFELGNEMKRGLRLFSLETSALCCDGERPIFFVKRIGGLVHLFERFSKLHGITLDAGFFIDRSAREDTPPRLWSRLLKECRS